MTGELRKEDGVFQGPQAGLGSKIYVFHQKWVIIVLCLACLVLYTDDLISLPSIYQEEPS